MMSRMRTTAPPPMYMPYLLVLDAFALDDRTFRE